MKYPYFRVSKKMNNPLTLQEWFDWFRSKDIGCAIVKRNRNEYTLWREGKESIDLFANRETLRGTVIQKYDPRGIFGEVGK